MPAPAHFQSHIPDPNPPYIPLQHNLEPLEESASSSQQLDGEVLEVPPPQFSKGSEPVPVPVPVEGLTDPAQLAALGLDAEAVPLFQLRVDRILRERAELTFKRADEGEEQSYEKMRLNKLQYELNRDFPLARSLRGKHW